MKMSNKIEFLFCFSICCILNHLATKEAFFLTVALLKNKIINYQDDELTGCCRTGIP
jgi:hypothetical protein